MRIRATARVAQTLLLVVEDITAERERRSVIEAVVEDRRRIAQEIHDGVIQNLAGLRFKIEHGHRLADTAPERLHAELDQLQEIVGASIIEMRRSILALRPVSLDEQGFLPALQKFVAAFGERRGVNVSLSVNGSPERLPFALELTLFRVIQEALNNAGKHAQAGNVWIELDLQAPDTVAATIRDDGQGFDPASLAQDLHAGHLGLQQMRERVEQAQGSLDIQSRPGQGCLVRVSLPLRQVFAGTAGG